MNGAFANVCRTLFPRLADCTDFERLNALSVEAMAYGCCWRAIPSTRTPRLWTVVLINSGNGAACSSATSTLLHAALDLAMDALRVSHQRGCEHDAVTGAASCPAT